MSTQAPPPVSASPGAASDGAGPPTPKPEGSVQLVALPVVLTAVADSFAVLQGWKEGHARLVVVAVGLVMAAVIVGGLRQRRLSATRALTGFLILAAATVIAVWLLPATKAAPSDTGTRTQEAPQSAPPEQPSPTPPTADPSSDLPPNPPMSDPGVPPTASAPPADGTAGPSETAAPTTAPRSVPPPVAPSGSTDTPVDANTSTDAAVCTPRPGRLEFTEGSLTNSGGPNYVPDGCSEIGLVLTAVTRVIHAQACLEFADGTPTGQCGAWERLKDGGAWNVLYADAPPGTRWVLNMTAAGPDSVEFDFTG